MRSINIYWDIRKRNSSGGLLNPLRKRRVNNRFTAVECAATVASLIVLERATGGAYPFLPDAFRRMNSGELKLKMNMNNIEPKFGGK